MVKLNGLFVIFLVSLLLFTGCKNPATSSDILPKDWSNASIVDKITADDGAASRFFGSAAAISGDTAIVGAYFDNEKGSSSGSVYFFEKGSGVWTQSQKLTADDGAAIDWFGYSVAISGNTAIVGAFQDDDKGTNSGSVYFIE